MCAERRQLELQLVGGSHVVELKCLGELLHSSTAGAGLGPAGALSCEATGQLRNLDIFHWRRHDGTAMGMTHGALRDLLQQVRNCFVLGLAALIPSCQLGMLSLMGHGGLASSFGWLGAH